MEQLVCKGKTLGSSSNDTDDGSHRYGLQSSASMFVKVTVFVWALAVALAQIANDTDC